ncbi:hypothetical protein [Hymenobacter chitinivorans]|uniref:NTF2 fold immunity protein of polymorphic toxin system component n=1 Tax=Hymenobacter chitinivorans DSM 11115 TaxID=1121954 RepID=A0A2M9BLN6_9BACT|nr:hypothetical protein [Hymenobacter chitinivorans]PJJ58868.1 hypothetical protein CLV45_0279 [Hymenobacter chitinivorans DSM 11115]
MIKALSWLLAGALSATACQPTPDRAAPATATTAAAVTNEAQAREAVNSYLQEMPEGGEYNFDSAMVMQADRNWLVLVPSIPGEGRKPNSAAFTVHKQTGDIRVQFLPRAGK